MVVLRLCLCGIYQPPIRAGALRLITAHSQLLEDCCCQKCKWVDLTWPLLPA